MTFAIAAPDAPREQRPWAAAAYIFTWVSGLLVLLIARREQRYLRWNAMQAIGLGAFGMLLGFLGSILGAIVFASYYLDGTGPPWFIAWGGLGVFGAAVAAVVVVLIVAGAVGAYRGTPVRLPVVARIADRFA